MKLFNWIFAKPKKQENIQPSYVFKSWEASAKDYNKTHNIRNRLIQVRRKRMYIDEVKNNAFYQFPQWLLKEEPYKDLGDKAKL